MLVARPELFFGVGVATSVLLSDLIGLAVSVVEDVELGEFESDCSPETLAADTVGVTVVLGVPAENDSVRLRDDESCSVRVSLCDRSLLELTVAECADE